MVKDRKFFVFAHLDSAWQPAGRLTLAEEGGALIASEFAYGLNYLKRVNAIEIDPVSLGLTDKNAIAKKTLYPANNLPHFGGIRDAAPDAWGRRVIEAKLAVPVNSLPESEYLIQAGSERVGALDVRASLDAPAAAPLANWASLQYLIDAAARIEAGQPIPKSLAAIFHGGSALGGARPKASVRDDAGTLWLAKFSSHHDAFDMPMIEACTLKLAHEAGLTVPTVQRVTVGKDEVMMIARFDRTRVNTAAEEVRHPFVSALTMLGCDETESRNKSYADLAAAIRRYCHPSVIRADNAELFRRMIFNIFVSNDDDHLRNHGFLWDSGLPGWRLSPLYDVLPRPSVAFERFLHLGVGPLGRAATIDNAMQNHQAFTLTKANALEAIAHIWATVRVWKQHFENAGAPSAQIKKIAPAFRHLDDVTSKTLRRALP